MVITEEEYIKAVIRFKEIENDQFRSKECMELINKIVEYEKNTKYKC